MSHQRLASRPRCRRSRSAISTPTQRPLAPPTARWVRRRGGQPARTTTAVAASPLLPIATPRALGRGGGGRCLRSPLAAARTAVDDTAAFVRSRFADRERRQGEGRRQCRWPLVVTAPPHAAPLREPGCVRPGCVRPGCVRPGCVRLPAVRRGSAPRGMRGAARVYAASQRCAACPGLGMNMNIFM